MPNEKGPEGGDKKKWFGENKKPERKILEFPKNKTPKIREIKASAEPGSVSFLPKPKIERHLTNVGKKVIPKVGNALANIGSFVVQAKAIPRENYTANEFAELCFKAFNNPNWIIEKEIEVEGEEKLILKYIGIEEKLKIFKDFTFEIPKSGVIIRG